MRFKMTFFSCLLSVYSYVAVHAYEARPAKLGEITHQLLLEEIISGLNIFIYHCAAAAIDKSWALTTGFCIWEMKKDEARIKDFQVVAGRVNLTKPEASEQIRLIAAVYPYNKYPLAATERISIYDIGLIRLSNPLDLNKWVHVIALPKENEEIDDRGMISGWSFIRNRPMKKHGSDKSLNIQMLDILDEETCENSVPKNRFAIYVDKGTFPHNYIFCARPKFTENSVCTGDTGGALIKKKKNLFGKNKIIGILSYVVRLPSDREGPSIYTKVSKFIPWITSIMSTA